MTRYQTYQMPYGFITVDTNTESAPTDSIAGPFMVNMTEAEQIKDGAMIEIVDDEAIVVPQEEG